MKNKYYIIYLLLFVSSFAFSQTYTMGTDTGVQTTCSGTFVDSGGTGGGASADYNTSENFTITFCPTTPGDLIQISFTQFESEAIGATLYDYLEYWNANSNAGAADGVYGGSLPAFVHTSTSPDGCVTFEWTSDFTSPDKGWEATISCITPCSPPTASLVDTTTVDICNPNATNPGSLTVAFDASASTAVGAASIVSYEWIFGDGTTATTATPTTSHTYPATSGVYIAYVSVIDDNTSSDPLGCKSTNATSKIIRVLPEPNFSSTPTAYNINCGDTVTLTGVVSSQTETQATPAVVGSTINLPDGSGASYSSSLDFTGYFPVGATMAAGCYPTITFDLEHSYSGDLEIELIAPTGESVMMYDQHGGGTGFGSCVNGADDLVPGCTATYTVVPTGGTTWTAATQLTAPPTANGTCTYTGTCETGNYYDPAITYTSFNPFTTLNGADLNGSWTIKITDNISFDDGIIDAWSIDFPSACFGTLETVTPDLTTATWSGGGPALPAQTTTSTGVVDPGPDACPTAGTCTGTQLTNSPLVGPFATPGASVYTLTIVDEFGCEYTQDVTVTATCSCILTLDVAGTQTQTVCENTAITDITYTVGGDATGATIGGTLPPGVTGTYAAGVFTISGTPTSAVGSPFNYSVTTVGCTPNLTENGTITVNPLPTYTVASSNPTTCSGTEGTITLNGLTASTAYNVTYTDDGTVVGPTSMTSDASGDIIITGLNAGSYTAITVDLAGCITVDAGVFGLSDPLAPTYTVASSNPTTCSGTEGTITLSGLTASTAYNITYTDDGTVVGPTSMTSDGSGDIVITGLNAGSYTAITVELSNCITVDAGVFGLSDPGAPTYTVASSNPTTCSGTEGTITLSGLTASTAYNVTYTDDGTVVGPTSMTSDASGDIIITGLNAGSYTAITVDLAGCITVDAGVFGLSDPLAPTYTVASSNPTTCSGTEGTITLSGLTASTAYNVTYTDDGTVVGPTSMTSDASGDIVIIGLNAGSYTAITVNLAGCITVDAGVFGLSDPLAPTYTVASSNPTTCSGTEGTITLSGLTASTAYNVTYTDDGTVVGPTSMTSDASGDIIITGLNAGSYTAITVELSNCSTVDAGVFGLSDPLAPTYTVASSNPTTCSGTEGTITLSGLTASTAYNVTYTDDGTVVGPTSMTSDVSGDIIITGLNAGSYTAITVDLAGCITVDAGVFGLSDPLAPTYTVASSNPTTCSGTEGTITLSGLTASTAYNVTYTDDGTVVGPTSMTSDASGDVIITGLNAGSYTAITVELSNCSTIDAGVFGLSDPLAPTYTVASSNPTTCSGTEGTITLSGLTASTAYNVTYTDDGTAVGPTSMTSDASGDIIITGLNAGSYTAITVELSNCITIDAGVFGLSDPLAPTYTVASSNPTTCSGTEGIITLSGLTASTAYNVTYTDDGTVVGPTSMTSDASGDIVITGLNAGSYTTITVELSNCSTIDAGVFGLSDPLAPTYTVASSNPTTCGGTDGTITLSGLTASTAYNVTYTDDGTVVGPTSMTSDASGDIVITGLNTGSYTAITVDLAGCITVDAGVFGLSDPGAPTYTVASSNPTTCSGTEGTITLSGLTASTAYNITYTDDGTVVGPTSMTSDVSGDIIITGLNAGSYTAITVDLAGCSTVDAGVFGLSDPLAPTYTVASSNPTTCSGTEGTITLSGLTASTAYNVTYTDDGTVVGPTSMTSDASGDIIITGLNAGSYTAITVDLAGCITVDAGVFGLSDPLAPTYTVASSNPTTCSGTEGTITLSGLTASTAYNVTYTVDGTVVGPTSMTSDVSGDIIITGLNAGSYTAITVDLAGCSTVDAGVFGLSDPLAPTYTVASSNPTTCSGTEGTITLSGLTASTAYNVTYTDDGTVVGPTSMTSDASGDVIITGLNAGSYTAITVELSNCSTVDAGVFGLSDPLAPAYTVASSNPTTCSGTEGTITLSGLTASTAYNVTYTDDGTVVGPTSMTSDASGDIIITGLNAGSYTAITVELSNCSTVDAGVFGLSDPLAPTYTVASSNPTTCSGTEGTITLSGLTISTAYNITYTDDGTVVGPTSMTSDVSGDIIITGLNAGSYTAITVDLAGCSTVDAGVFGLSDPLAPTYTVASSNPTTCSGTEGTITLSGLTVSTAYNVTYTDDGTIVGPTSMTSDASGDIVITGLNSGSYTAITVELSNCSTVDAGVFGLSDPLAPAYTVANSNPTTCGGTDGTITLSGLTASTAYNVTYTDDGTVVGPTSMTSDASGDIIITGLNSGSYTAITVELSSCSTIDAGVFGLTDPGAPTYTVASSNPTTCSGTEGTITLSGLTASTAYNVTYTDDGTVVGPTSMTSDGSGDIVITGLNAGSYTAITVDLAGCSTVDAGVFGLSDPLAPTYTVASSNPTTCSGTEGTITLSGLTVSTAYNITYTDDGTVVGPTSMTSDASGDIVITGLNAGSYTAITVELSNCSTVDAGVFGLSDPLAPTYTVASSNPTTCSGTEGTITLSGLTVSTAYNVTYTDDGTVVGPTSMTSDASGDIIITGLNAGSYTAITVELSNCSTVDAGVFGLSDPLAPTYTVASSNPTTCSGTEGTITLSGLTASTAYNVTYTDDGTAVGPTSMTSDASGDIVITGLNAGSYTAITVELSNCSTVDAGVFGLSDPLAPTYTVASSNPTTCSGTEGTITLSGLTASTAYNVTYTDDGTVVGPTSMTSDGSGDIVITGLNAGSYTAITVELSNCSTVDAGVFGLSDPLAPTYTVASSNPTTCSGTEGTITLSGLTASTAYNVTYTDDGTVVGPTSMTSDVSGDIIITGLNAGSYTAITVDLAGCITVDAGVFGLSDPLAPTYTVASSNPTTCSGTEGTITLSGLTASTAYNVTYTDDGTVVGPTSMTSDASGDVIITGLNAGSYTAITVELSNCSTIDAGVFGLSDPLAPTYTVASSNPTTCSGTEGTITLSGLTASTAYNVTYTDDGTAVGPTSMTSDASGDIIITGLNAGSYTAITVELSNCSTVDAGVFGLSDPLAPTYTVASSNPTTCSGTEGTITLSGLTASTAYNITYTDDGTVVGPTSMTSDASGDIVITGLNAGSYTAITVELSNCSTVDAGVFGLSDPLAPTYTVASSNPTTCSGTEGTITLSGLTVSTAYNVTYTDDGTVVGPTSMTSDASGDIVITGLNAGSYTAITVELSNCSTIDAGVFGLSDPSLPTLALNINTNPTTCSGNDGSIALTTSNLSDGSYTINYEDATATAQTAIMVVAGNVGVISGLSAGTYNDITVTNVNCTSIANIDVVLTDPLPPVAIANQDMPPVCDDDIDGIMIFDLTSNIGLLTGGASGVTTTFYTGLNLDGTVDTTTGITNPSAYSNIAQVPVPIQTEQDIYVIIQNDATTCTSETSFTLTVNTVSFTPATNLYTCDDDNDTFGYFDLAEAELQITGGASNLEVTFHETSAEALNGVGIIPTGVLYQNVDTDGSGSGDVQTLYLNITDTNTGCSYTSETIILNVIASPELPEGPLTYALCEDAGSVDGVVAFDLVNYGQTVLLSNIDSSTLPGDYTITYYTGIFASGLPDPTTIIANPNAYQNTSTPDQVIYASVMHTATGCEIIIEITLHVDLLPVANYSAIYECDNDFFDDMDGFYPFNLLDYESAITGGATDVSVDYFFNLADAESGTGSMIPDYTNFTNTINPQVIYASVYNSSTDCRAVSIVKLHVNANPTPLSTSDIITQLGDNGVMMECDGNVDGSGGISEQIAEFDLTIWETLILTGNGPGLEAGVSASYYTSLDDAETGTGAILTPTAFSNTSNPQTIYISVINDGSGVANTVGTGCHTITMFDIYVPVPEVNVVASKDVICVDANGVPLTSATLPVLTATAGPASAASYDYQWLLNGAVIPGATTQTYSVTEPGDYSVTVSGPTDFDCINISAIQTIEVSGSPENYNASVTTQAFADSHQVVAEATSSIPGIEFWYSLDDGEPTTNGTFDNVSPGIHIITITDGEGCWSDTQEVMIIDYPHFFTPNGDGINDTWAIIQQEGIPISQIYIFDRFGKLLKQLDPDSEGWDGTYNGTQMPATDYWFKIIYLEGDDSTQKEFKAHFSIKR